MRRIGEPFPHAAELEAARARRDGLDQAIRDAAAETGEPETADAGPEAGDEAAETYAIDLIDGPDEAERITISAIQAWPRSPEPGPGADTGPVAAEPPAPAPAASGNQEVPARIIQTPVFIADQDLTAEPLFALPPPPAGSASEPGAKPARRRDQARGPSPREAIQATLFDLPAPAAEPARRAGRGQARRREPRR